MYTTLLCCSIFFPKTKRIHIVYKKIIYLFNWIPRRASSSFFHFRALHEIVTTKSEPFPRAISSVYTYRQRK